MNYPVLGWVPRTTMQRDQRNTPGVNIDAAAKGRHSAADFDRPDGICFVGTAATSHTSKRADYNQILAKGSRIVLPRCSDGNRFVRVQLKNEG